MNSLVIDSKRNIDFWTSIAVWFSLVSVEIETISTKEIFEYEFLIVLSRAMEDMD